LDEDHWGQGLATEAARTSVEYGFGTAGLREVIGLVVEGNIGSIRVLEKCGFVFQERAEYFNIECLKHKIDRARYADFYQDK
jgi:RimJ/RimL family protein N-acetyltransferase